MSVMSLLINSMHPCWIKVNFYKKKKHFTEQICTDTDIAIFTSTVAIYSFTLCVVYSHQHNREYIKV